MIKKYPLSAGSSILLGFAVLTVASAVITWRLSPIPFGIMFKTFGYLTLLGLFGYLSTLALTGLRSRRLLWKIQGAVPGILEHLRQPCRSVHGERQERAGDREL